MKTTLAVSLVYFMVLLSGGSAAVTWDNGAGDSNWFNATNWIGDVLPGATDDVFVVTNGTGYNNGQVGTIYWRFHAPGTLFSIR